MNELNNIEQPNISLHMLMQDSAPRLVEWVLHHHRIGIHRIIVHGDGANAQAEALCRSLERVGLIKYRPTPHPGLAKAQFRENMVSELILNESSEDDEYILWLTPADFVIIETGNGTIGDLFAKFPKAPDVLSLTCQVVGASGQMRFSDELLFNCFKRGTSDGRSGPLAATLMRSLFRPDLAKKIRDARPVLKPKYAKQKQPVLWLNGSGEDTGERYLQGGWLAPREAPGFGLGRVVCYMSQDPETWLLRHIGAGPVLPFITPDMLKDTISQFRRWNFNMIDVVLPANASEALAQLREELFREDPEVRQAHQAVIAEFGSRLGRLLVVQEPQAREIIGQFLEGKSPHPSLFKWKVPIGVKTTFSAIDERTMPWASKLTARKNDTEHEKDLWAGTDQEEPARNNGNDKAPESERSAVSQQSLAPSWLADLRLSGQAHGFYHSMPNYACVHIARSGEHLLVSFDNLSSARDNPIDRDPWGYEFIRKSGWSHLGVMSFVPSWFRNADLHSYLFTLKESGFFRRYKSVTMFGTSMGGYGATAFSSLAPGCKVAAFSPQSSLSRHIAPWDGRYNAGRRADWDGEFADAAGESTVAEQVWLFYDPSCELDLRHCERFTSPNARFVPLRNAGHQTALMLRNGGALSKTMRCIVTGQATRSSLLHLYRSCRLTPAYLDVLREKALKSGGKKRLKWLESAIKSTKTGPVA